MWQRFTERARRVIFYAQEEAGHLGENAVATEHLLLGLTRDDDHLAARILTKLGCSLETLRKEVERQVARSNREPGQETQLTPRAKRVIDLAYDEARMLRNNYIGTEHILLGLIREGEGLAGRILFKLGVELEPAREYVKGLQDHDASLPVEEPAAMPMEESQKPGARQGDLGIAQEPVNGGQLVLAISEEDYQELSEVVAIKDDYAFYEMVQSGKVFSATPVRAKLLRKGNSGGFLVRLLDGDLAGKVGWLPPEQFERTGPDDRPFPPPLPPSSDSSEVRPG
jgi:hypothetical protein